METIREMDWTWYWLGYSMGVNSRKRIKEMPDKLTNMGKMGVITIPNEQQKTSFFIGLMIGRRKIINNLNIINILTTIGKKGLSTADMLTLGVVEVEGIRGGYVDIPVYINKNAADNRGVAGFQLKLSYNNDYLDLVSIDKSAYWTGSFVSDTSTAGVILAQGVKEVADKQDLTVCFIRFLVKETVPSGLTNIPITLQGRVGTGSGSELLTLINDELYYITPIKLQNGAVLLEAIQEEKEPIGSITYPSTGTSTIGTGNSSVSYDFTATLGYPSGLTYGGGTYAWLNVYLDGQLIGRERVELEQGEKNYKGKIPISLPSLKTGKITYEIVVEDETGFAYVFIKAGALFILESEVKRDEVNELELEPFNREVIDRMKIIDIVVFEKFKQSGGGPVDLTIIDRVMKITDKETINVYKQISKELTDMLLITDSLRVNKFKEQGSKSEDSMRITDIVIFTKSK